MNTCDRRQRPRAQTLPLLVAGLIESQIIELHPRTLS